MSSAASRVFNIDLVVFEIFRYLTTGDLIKFLGLSGMAWLHAIGPLYESTTETIMNQMEEVSSSPDRLAKYRQSVRHLKLEQFNEKDTAPDVFILGKLRKKYPNIKSVKVPYISSIFLIDLTMSLDPNETVEEDTSIEQLSYSNGEQGGTQNAMALHLQHLFDTSTIGKRWMGSETGSETDNEPGALHLATGRLNIGLDVEFLEDFDKLPMSRNNPASIPDFEYLRDNPNARLRTLTFVFPDRQVMFPLCNFSGVLYPFSRMSRMLLNEVTTFRCNVGGGDQTHITRLCSFMKNLRVLDFISRDPVDLLNSYNCLALGGMKNLERLSLSCSPVDWTRIQIPLRITQKLRVVRCDFEEVLYFLPSDRYQCRPHVGDSWFPNYLIFLSLEVLFITDVYKAWRSIAFDTIDIQQVIRYFDALLPVACKVRLICCPSHTPDFLDQETVDRKPNANVPESELCHQIAALEATLESYRRAARSTVEQVPLSGALPGWAALGETTS